MGFFFSAVAQTQEHDFMGHGFDSQRMHEHICICITSMQCKEALNKSISQIHTCKYFHASFWLIYTDKCNSEHTCDADFGRPLRRPVQNALLDLFHLSPVARLGNVEHFLDQLEDLRFVTLTDLHAVLQDHDDVLRPILGSVFRALLSRSWRPQHQL